MNDAIPDDYARELQVAESLARGAGAVLMQTFRSATLEVGQKGQIDFVTEADRASEAFVVQGLQQAFPDDGIFGEEGTRILPDAARQWVIDPLDGTTNYTHGLPHFAVLIALRVRGVVNASICFNPNTDECFTAVRGRGAHCNGTALSVSGRDRLADALLVSGFSYGRRQTEDDNIAEFSRIAMIAKDLHRHGSAGLDLAAVAAGRIDGYWEANLKPWDCVGGILLVAEAGGVVTDYQGRAVGAPEGDADSVEAGRVVAAGPRLHPQLLAAIAEARSGVRGNREGLESWWMAP